MLTGRAVGFIAIAALACSGPTVIGPQGVVRPGVYVLATLDGRGPPFITSKVNRADGGVSTSQIAFDSIYIDSDSGFVRAFQLEAYEQEPGGQPERIDATSTRIAGSILIRGNEVVLTDPPTPFYVGHPGYFAPRNNTLRARLQVSEHLCVGTGPCTYTFNHFVDAVYTLR